MTIKFWRLLFYSSLAGFFLAYLTGSGVFLILGLMLLSASIVEGLRD